MFVRVKKVNGKEYAYLVENIWKEGKTRQRVKKYLGPVVRMHGQKKPLPPRTGTYRDAIMELIRHEVEGTGIAVGKRGSIRRDGREVVAAINHGYLCTHTARQLLDTRQIEEPRKGEHLAELLTRAGITIRKDTFVSLYRLLANPHHP